MALMIEYACLMMIVIECCTGEEGGHVVSWLSPFIRPPLDCLYQDPRRPMVPEWCLARLGTSIFSLGIQVQFIFLAHSPLE